MDGKSFRKHLAQLKGQEETPLRTAVEGDGSVNNTSTAGPLGSSTDSPASSSIASPLGAVRTRTPASKSHSFPWIWVSLALVALVILSALGYWLFHRGRQAAIPLHGLTPATPTLTPSTPLTPSACWIDSRDLLATPSENQFSLYCGECTTPFQISCAKASPILAQWRTSGANLSEHNQKLLDAICKKTTGHESNPKAGGVNGAQPSPCN